MNIKHELFAQAVIKNKGHLSLAYQEAYPSANPESARHGGSALWKKVEIQTRVNEILETQGLGIIELTKKLKDLTEAKKPGTFGGFVPDNNARLEAIKIAYKLHGLIGSNTGGNEIFLMPEQLALLEKEQKSLIEEE